MAFTVEKFNECLDKFFALKEKTDKCVFSVDFFCTEEEEIYTPGVLVDIYQGKLRLVHNTPNPGLKTFETLETRRQIETRVLSILENFPVKVKSLGVISFEGEIEEHLHMFE